MLCDFFRDVRSRLIDFEVRRINSAFLELAADATDATEVVSRPAARTPPFHARRWSG